MSFSVNVPKLQSAAEKLGDIASKLSVLESNLNNFSISLTLGDSSKLINVSIKENASRLSGETVKVRVYLETLLMIISFYENAENEILGNENTRKAAVGIQSLSSGNILNNTNTGAKNNEIDKKLADDIKKALAWKWEYSYLNWLFSSPENRKQIIRDMLALLAPIYGITAPNLIIGPEQDPTPGLTTGGYYEAETNTIWINEDFFRNGFIGKDDAVHTLLHEMRHAYQYDVINNPDNYRYDENTINQWRNDYYGYISPEEDFSAYDNQSIETDADDFADRIQTQDWWY